MVYYSERLDNMGHSAHSSVCDKIAEMLLTTVCKKAYQDRFAYVKKWEKEKIIHLGLTNTIVQQLPLDDKRFYTSAWEKEKLSEFGLIGAGSHRSHYFEESAYQPPQQSLLHKVLGAGKQVFALLAEQVSIAREMMDEDELYEEKTSQSQSVQESTDPRQGKEIDKFLKDLGYE
jgi:hypothetical protein